jgi:hypothetical protein
LGCSCCSGRAARGWGSSGPGSSTGPVPELTNIASRAAQYAPQGPASVPASAAPPASVR